MNGKSDSELGRIRETKMRISEELHHDLERAVDHYMELQKRHQDRLVYSCEASTQDILKDAADDAAYDD